MGSDLTVFLEFCGLPGSGKSTVSHLVAEQLRSMGKKVSEPSYEADHLFSKRKRNLWKLSKLFGFMLRCPTRFCRLTGQFWGNGCFGREYLSQAVNITYKMWTYAHPRAEYVVFDEGLIQSAASLGAAIDMGEGICRELYNVMEGKRVAVFYICADPATVLHRLAAREEHDSHIEKLDTDRQRLEYMNRYLEQCQKAMARGSAFEIDVVGHSVEESVQKAMRVLMRPEYQL